MDLEAVLELGPEDKWDFSIDVDRIPKELLERTGPEIPAVLHVPEGYTLPNSSQRIKGYLSLFAYACLSLAVHGVILKTIDSPIPFFHSVKTEEHQQDLLKEYLENHVSKTVREQISSEAKESGDITETIKELLDHYQTQKKELVETTAKDLRDGKLDDIKLAEFVLTLQTLRRNIYYLEKDDYPLEKLSDPQAISSEFQGKAREARVLGTSCDLESLVQLHSFVFNKVINTGYNPNRDSVLSALEGMSQCESGTEGFVLFEDEVSACSDVGLILFGNHQRIGVVHGREGYVLAAEPGAPLLKYTEGKFVPKAVMAAQYLVDEGVSLETFPESIQRYFRDDPSLDKANDVTLAKRGETITEEPWAKKASIPTRANFREGEDSLKIQYWDITPKLAERRGVNPSKEQLSDREVELLQQIQEARDDLQKKKEQVTQIHLEDCVKQAGFEYAAQKARDDGFLRVLPRGITYDEILTFGFNSEDRPELWHLKKIADQAGYALMSAFQKESVRGVEVLSGLTGLTELSAMPGAERETLEMAQKIVDYAKEVDSAKKRDPSLKLTYDITPISEEVFGIIASTHLPEAAVYLEQQVKEYLGKKDSVAIYAFNARINMTSSSGRRIPFQTFTSKEVRDIVEVDLISDYYQLSISSLAGTDSGNPMYRNIARHILFGEPLGNLDLPSQVVHEIEGYRELVVPNILDLSTKMANGEFNLGDLWIYTNALNALVELKDHSSCDDLSGLVSLSRTIDGREFKVLEAMGKLQCEGASRVFQEKYQKMFPGQLEYVQQTERGLRENNSSYAQYQLFQEFLRVVTTYDPGFPQDDVKNAVTWFDNSAASALHPTPESAQFLRETIDREYFLDRPTPGVFGYPNQDVLVRLAQIEREKSIPYLVQKFREVNQSTDVSEYDKEKATKMICTALVHAQNSDLYLNDVHPPSVSRLSGDGGVLRLEFRR